MKVAFDLLIAQLSLASIRGQGEHFTIWNKTDNAGQHYVFIRVTCRDVTRVMLPFLRDDGDWLEDAEFIVLHRVALLSLSLSKKNQLKAKMGKTFWFCYVSSSFHPRDGDLHRYKNIELVRILNVCLNQQSPPVPACHSLSLKAIRESKGGR